MKVKPTDAAPPNQPVELIAARNEFVSFQVVVRGDGSQVSNVSASFPGLNGPGSIPQSNIQLYRAEYLNITKPSFTSAPAGRYPDALIPDVDETVGEKRNAFPFNVPANESRIIWVDVLVPQGIPAGSYTGTVKVTGDGLAQDIPVSLNVLDTELPSTSNVATAFLFHRNMACATHTGDSECGGEEGSYKLRNVYQKLALEHRITLSNTLTFPSNGDWATFDTRYSPWLDGTAPSRLPGAKMTTAQYPGKRENAQFTAFEQHFKEKGWISRAYDYTGDEPPYGITYDEALRRANQVKQAAPELRTLLTTTVTDADEHGLTPVLDLIVPVINFIDGTEAPFVGNQRKHYDNFLTDPKNGFWIYQSCMSHGCAYGTTAPENKPGAGWPSYMADASAAKNRAMQWLVFAERASGELYYETALALDTSWNDIHRFNGNGDGTLFYPGLPSRIGGTTDVPLPSIRLKHIRQGMQDYEWLKKVADAGDPEFAMKIARSVVPTAHGVTDDGEAFEVARKQLMSRWLELQPKPPESKPPPLQQVDQTNPIGGLRTPGVGPEVDPETGEIIPGDSSDVEGKAGCAAAPMSAAALPGGVLAGLIALSRLRRRTRR